MEIEVYSFIGGKNLNQFRPLVRKLLRETTSFFRKLIQTMKITFKPKRTTNFVQKSGTHMTILLQRNSVTQEFESRVTMFRCARQGARSGEQAAGSCSLLLVGTCREEIRTHLL
jgi:hypothetical protein